MGRRDVSTPRATQFYDRDKASRVFCFPANERHQQRLSEIAGASLTAAEAPQ
jgi:hypothetical protein